MTRIYTKTGDAGQTSLFGGGRVAKDHPRVQAYGELDELNATLGMARAAGLAQELDALIEKLQVELFTVGSVLATPTDTKAANVIPLIESEWVSDMEAAIDRLETELPPMTHFILPGGSPASATLHLARTVCRRVERHTSRLHLDGEIGPEPGVYLNRLSDLLFVLARVANHRAGVEDVKWIPKKRG
jgi:cob(I)alamin adenosyltransferase